MKSIWPLSALQDRTRTGQFPLYAELGLLAALLLCPLAYQLPFEIDYDILWAAGYRSTFGQQPYADYGLPTGPVAPWILAAWFAVTDGSASSMRYLDLLVDGVTAAAFWLMARELKFTVTARFVSTAILIFLFLNKLSLPFYNSWVVAPIMVALWLAACALRPGQNVRRSAVAAALAGVAAAIAFFIKQDSGGMAVLVVGAFLLYGLLSGRITIAVLAAYAVGGILASVVIVAPVYGPAFFYWFDHGQHQGGSRLRAMLTGMLSDFGRLKIAYLIACAVACAALAHSKSTSVRAIDAAFVVCGATLISLVAGAMSGRGGQTTQYFIAFAALVSIELLAAHTVSRIFWPAMLAVALVLSVPVLPQTLTIARPLIQKRMISVSGEPASVAGAAGLRSFGGVYLTDNAIAAIRDLKSWPISKRACSFLNLSELAPIDAELGIEPCRGTPVWTHLGISLYPREEDWYVRNIESKAFDAVIYGDNQGLLDLRGPRIKAAIEAHYNPVRCFASYNNASRVLCTMRRKD